MSSADHKTSRRGALRALALASTLPLVLGGCLRPLYGTAADGSNVVADMSGIIVDDLPDRLGHYLVQEVRYALDGSGNETTSPRYRLTMSATETVQSAIVNTSTGRATAATLYVKVTYTLKSLPGDAPIHAGTATMTASYDRGPQRFASVRAARDAEIRIAKTLADQIRTRLAAYFATRRS
ncbi:LPS assembly lipoprotein LptE [uncultured Alsobacter sp.]|uniref:LPS assembly lipoprotein LptE n=1 Tax=uncultured Alsobacter sp. TaxID=1748258 RepID=UPI0025E21D08|nr:LPS assembly lipoprotein LptE [uncultured Alsobacter sp.]